MRQRTAPPIRGEIRHELHRDLHCGRDAGRVGGKARSAGRILGSVASSSMLRERMREFSPVFAEPQYSTDNAMGIAVLTALQKTVMEQNIIAVSQVNEYIKFLLIPRRAAQQYLRARRGSQLLGNHPIVSLFYAQRTRRARCAARHVPLRRAAAALPGPGKRDAGDRLRPCDSLPARRRVPTRNTLTPTARASLRCVRTAEGKAGQGGPLIPRTEADANIRIPSLSSPPPPVRNENGICSTFSASGIR